MPSWSGASSPVLISVQILSPPMFAPVGLILPKPHFLLGGEGVITNTLGSSLCVGKILHCSIQPWGPMYPRFVATVAESGPSADSAAKGPTRHTSGPTQGRIITYRDTKCYLIGSCMEPIQRSHKAPRGQRAQGPNLQIKFGTQVRLLFQIWPLGYKYAERTACNSKQAHNMLQVMAEIIFEG